MKPKILLSLFLFFTCLFFTATAQEKKYQGLLWEISGNGLKKPSYLYGTMHVSEKLAFYLGDSFFMAIKNADVVALETRPDTWLEEMIKFDMTGDIMNLMYNGGGRDFGSEGEKDLSYALQTLDKKKIADILSREPQLINSFLYRSNDRRNNFEESTYLDLFIFQLGRKMGKEVIGVEDFAESMKLLEKAYERVNEETDKLKGYEDVGYINRFDLFDKIEDAYRRGDLDLLDSLEKLATPSKNYHEYMLWKRNELMVDRIADVLKKQTMFIGVGAAHLPGNRGMIDLLRNKGYQMRPVTFTGRNEKLKEKYDNMTVSLPFQKYESKDGLLSMEVPGKVIEFPYQGENQMSLYTDMVNGNYYTISRLANPTAFYGKNPEYVLERVDSLLFENIPGKITKKEGIDNNGIRGMDIINRTKTGDYQRYNIFATNYELIVIKLGGKGKFATGKEAEKFFKSIRIHSPQKSWEQFSPNAGGFSVEMPGKPWDNTNRTEIKTGPEDRKDFIAYDPAEDASYLVMTKTFHFTEYLDEDSFELLPVLRSFENSCNLEKQWQKRKEIAGRQGIDAEFTTDDGYKLRAQVLLKGAHFYLLAVKAKEFTDNTERFFSSFKLIKQAYNKFEPQEDTTLHFTVNSTHKPITGSHRKRDQNSFKAERKYSYIANQNTGEIVVVDYNRFHRYYTPEDTQSFWKQRVYRWNSDSDYLLNNYRFYYDRGLPSMNLFFTDTNSSRAFYIKEMLRGDATYTLYTLIDTIEGPSAFVQETFATFKPEDTLTGTPIFEDKTSLFFSDIYSTDSASRDGAVDDLHMVKFKDEQAPQLMTLLDTCDLCQTERGAFLMKIGSLKHPQVLPYLEEQYRLSGDTASRQVSVLRSMLNQKTATAYQTVKKYLLKEPPLPSRNYSLNTIFYRLKNDSLKLTASLFPEILELAYLPEYRGDLYELLALMVDSGAIEPETYINHKNHLVMEMRTNLRRIVTAEKNNYSNHEIINEIKKQSVILLPFYEEKEVRELFYRALSTNLTDLKAHVALEMLKKKKTVPDSIITSLAANKKERMEFYESLEKAGLKEKFPKAYLVQDSMAEGIAGNLVKNQFGYLADSLVQIDKRWEKHRGDSGFIYVYRVKQNFGESWDLVSVGLQPKDQDKFVLTGTFNSVTQVEWKKRGNASEQVDKLIEDLKINKRGREKTYKDDEGYLNLDIVVEFETLEN